jgi:hypothetical protein
VQLPPLVVAQLAALVWARLQQNVIPNVERNLLLILVGKEIQSA